MQFKEALEKLEGSEQFKQWRKKNKEDFLSYGFCQVEGLNKSDWQIGYHNLKDDKATSFIVGEEITLLPSEEVFKKPEDKVMKLDINKAKLTYEQIIGIIDDFQKSKYPNEIVNKKIIIFQNLKDFGDIWNITLVTQAFNTINMKIDPSTGEVLSEQISSLLDLWKKDK